MNRENKKMKYEKGYYKNHPCTDSFTCKNCGRPVVSAGAGSAHRNHCPNCLASLHVDTELFTTTLWLLPSNQFLTH